MTSAYSSGDHRPAVIVSSFCKANGCVGVGVDGAGLVVVDTKSDGPALRLSRAEWTAFVAGVKGGLPILP